MKKDKIKSFIEYFQKIENFNFSSLPFGKRNSIGLEEAIITWNSSSKEEFNSFSFAAIISDIFEVDFLVCDRILNGLIYRKDDKGCLIRLKNNEINKKTITKIFNMLLNNTLVWSEHGVFPQGRGGIFL